MHSRYGLLSLFVAATSSMMIKPPLRTANGILHVDPKKHVKLNNLIEEPLIISLSRLSLEPVADRDARSHCTGHHLELTTKP